jgi:hypothetical protein
MFATWPVTGPPLTCCRRKDMTEKAAEAVKPDSEKSTAEKLGETATAVGDEVAAAVQPGETCHSPLERELH